MSEPHENVYHNDFVKLMKESWTKDLNESYAHNISFAKYMSIKTNDLQRYMKVKRRRTFGRQVQRLVEIRKRTGHGEDMNDLLKMLGLEE